MGKPRNKQPTPGVALDRVPPQNIDAERAILGALMLGGGSAGILPKVLDICQRSAFYREGHRLIYDAISTLYSEQKGVDIVTVTEQMTRNRTLENAGGVPYIDEMIYSVPTAANAEYWVGVIKEKAARRAAIQAAATLYNKAFDESEEITPMLGLAQKKMLDIEAGMDYTDPVEIGDILKSTLRQIEKAYETPGSLLGIPTGFSELDELTSGFQQADLIILAGRPGMGKSSLMQCFINHIGIKAGHRPLLFSLEMSSQQVCMRMLAMESGLNLQNIRSGYLGEANATDWAKLTIAAGKISQSHLMIDDTVDLNTETLLSRARRAVREKGVDILFVDYLQLLASSRQYDTGAREVGAISKALKHMGRELNVPVVALSQLSRQPENRPGNRPRLSDLRESGAIEQDADLVILMFRQKYYDNEADDIAEVEIAKQRNGPQGTIRLGFDAARVRFRALG